MHARGFQDLLELFAEATWTLSVVATIESAGTAYYLPERKRKIILEEKKRSLACPDPPENFWISNIHQGVRKSHFSPVDQAIPNTLEQS